mgnify:CR=1 FL=1
MYTLGKVDTTMDNEVNFNEMGLIYFTFDPVNAMFLFKKDMPTTYLYEEIVLIANELKQYDITYTIDSEQNLVLNI